MRVLIDKINQVLQEQDIEGLLQAGAPDDEYFSEAEEIATALSLLKKEQLSINIVLSIILFVWSKSFDLDTKELEKRQPLIQRVSDIILNIVNNQTRAT